MSLLMRVPPNLVQSIRAFRVPELQEEAARLGQHFLYAHCANGADQAAGVRPHRRESFLFSQGCSKNFDALRTA
jgi:hypothetical protein